MNDPALPSDPAAAHLLIRVDGEPRAERVAPQSPLRGLIAWCARRVRPTRRPLLDLRVDDALGRPVLSVQDPGSLIDLPLPSGTYHVSANFGRVRKSYTLALQAGTPFELHLTAGRT